MNFDAQGRERMPAFCLSVFHNPRALLQIVMMEHIVQQSKIERGSGNLEPLNIQTEMTSRDKEHV